jgi:hypothetical protein
MNHTEIELDNTKLTEMLNELSPFIPEGTTDKELFEFIRLAFYVDGMAAPRADGTVLATWEFDAGFLKLLPAFRAGKLSFGDIKSILNGEIGVHDNAGHNSSLMVLKEIRELLRRTLLFHAGLDWPEDVSVGQAEEPLKPDNVQ